MTRTVLTGTALALLLAAALGGCRDNEESFYIEHMKAISDPPDCKYSTGDAYRHGVTVDLALRQDADFFGHFQTTNALMAREDYDNLKAESNGIFVEGSEAVVTVGGQSVGGSAFSNAEIYIGPETTNVLPAIAIPGDVFQALADYYECPTADEMLAAMSAELLATGVTGGPEQYSPLLSTGYVTVRFVGHTQGGTDVETNGFTFTVDFCCGCAVDWYSCDTPCEMFCDQPSDAVTMCEWGVDVEEALGCTGWDLNPAADWPTEDVTVDGGVDTDAVVGTDCDLYC